MENQKRNRDKIRQDDPAKEKGVCIGNVCVSTINARYQGKARQDKARLVGREAEARYAVRHAAA
jgi:hypothetical protein